MNLVEAIQMASIDGYQAGWDAAAEHYHCAAGCEKAVAVQVGDRWVCARCGAPWIECNPDICPKGDENE